MHEEDGAIGRPRQRQTRREAGTQSYGLLTVRGGTDKAARLPKGWTGPVSKSGLRASARKPGFFCPLSLVTCHLSLVRSRLPPNAQVTSDKGPMPTLRN